MAYLNIKKTAAMLGVAPDTLHRLVEQCRIPAPIIIGENIKRWDEDELIEFLEKKKSEREKIKNNMALDLNERKPRKKTSNLLPESSRLICPRCKVDAHKKSNCQKYCSSTCRKLDTNELKAVIRAECKARKKQEKHTPSP